MWKIYLALAGLAIVFISMTYTNYLAKHLAEEERNKVKIWYSAIESLALGASDTTKNSQDYTLHLNIMESNKTIPAIIVNDRGNIDYGINFGVQEDLDTVYLRKQLKQIKSAGYPPIVIDTQSIYYKQSTLLTMLNYFPLIQFILIAAFITVGYLGFSNARRAEQNQVWVGMAKETAHQLGTPISAIMAWIEHLKAMENDDYTKEIIKELSNDVDRLTLVADRFSKIGSEPTLEKINVYEELEKCKDYMEKRAPRKVNFTFPGTESAPLFININQHLFDWVVENLLRNALDAMDGKGEISAQVIADKDFITIEISDTGKGIPSSKFKTVFEPGFTTKKRGWGLGLSLAKRIIESYHSGKIFVKRSEINKGSTFSIKLPRG